MLNETENGSDLRGNDPPKRDKPRGNKKKRPDFLKKRRSPVIYSILAVEFNGGVAMAVDLGGFYGDMSCLTMPYRLMKVNNQIIMAYNGEYTDFQYVKEIIDEKSMREDMFQDDNQMKAISLYNWLTGLMYARRLTRKPLWNSVVIAGFNNGKCFLGMIDKKGVASEDSCIATGIGSELALPMLRDSVAKHGGAEKMTQDQAVGVLTKCLEDVYNKDCRSLSVFKVATVTSEGVNLRNEQELQSNWQITHSVK